MSTELRQRVMIVEAIKAWTPNLNAAAEGFAETGGLPWLTMKEGMDIVGEILAYADDDEEGRITVDPHYVRLFRSFGLRVIGLWWSYVEHDGPEADAETAEMLNATADKLMSWREDIVMNPERP